MPSIAPRIPRAHVLTQGMPTMSCDSCLWRHAATWPLTPAWCGHCFSWWKGFSQAPLEMWVGVEGGRGGGWGLEGWKGGGVTHFSMNFCMDECKGVAQDGEWSNAFLKIKLYSRRHLAFTNFIIYKSWTYWFDFIIISIVEQAVRVHSPPYITEINVIYDNLSFIQKRLPSNIAIYLETPWGGGGTNVKHWI